MNPKNYVHIDAEVADLAYRFSASKYYSHYTMDGARIEGQSPEWKDVPKDPDVKEYYRFRVWMEKLVRLDHLVLAVLRDEYTSWPGYDRFWIVPYIDGSAAFVKESGYRGYSKVAVPAKRNQKDWLDLIWWERVANREITAQLALVRDDWLSYYYSGAELARAEERSYREELDYEVDWFAGGIRVPTYYWVTAIDRDAREKVLRDNGYRDGLDWPKPPAGEMSHYAEWA